MDARQVLSLEVPLRYGFRTVVPFSGMLEQYLLPNSHIKPPQIQMKPSTTWSRQGVGVFWKIHTLGLGLRRFGVGGVGASVHLGKGLARRI